MKTICDFSIRNGAVTERYSVERDNGDLFIHVGYGEDGPTDTLHIADEAAVRIATALLLAVGFTERTNALPRTKVVPIQSMQDMVTVGRWPA